MAIIQVKIVDLMKDTVTTNNLIDGKYRFQDLVDISLLEKMFTDFSKLTGYTTGIASHPNQEVLLKTGWRDACLLFHRKYDSSNIHCKQSNIKITENLKTHKTLNVYPCQNGLVDGATPIIIEGVHIANLFTGQALFEKPDIAKFKKQGANYGYDVDSYIKSIKKIPIVSEEKFLSTLRYLSNLTVLLVKQALIKIRAEESDRKLIQNEKKFKSLIENSVDIISVFDREGKTTFHSTSLEEKLGYPSGSTLQKSIFKHVLEKDQDRIKKQFETAMNKFGVTEEIHFRAYHKNGSVRYLEGSAKNMLNSPSIKGIVANYRDVTKQKKAASEIRKLSKVVETSNQSIIITDLEGTIIYVNATLLKNGLWNHENELIGNNLSHFTEKLAGNTIADVIMPTILEQGYFKGELIFKRKNGSTYLGDTNCTLIHDDDGKPEFFVGMFNDITELKKQQKVLKQERDALARFKKITINRELNAIKLKEEINHLLKELGRESKYKTGTEV